MATDITKKKILEIDTGKSQSNVKTLKTQIRELKEQLAQLEKGTEEYNRVAKQLADTNQKQIEINEAMKYSNQDVGATLSNLTRVAAGAIGAFNSMGAVMQLMGADSEEAAEAMKKIQLTMALIQGMSAFDTAKKSLAGLINAFSDFGKIKEGVGTKTTFSTASIVGEDAALVSDTAATKKNNEEAARFSDITQKNTEDTKESTESIQAETLALMENKAAMAGNTAEAEKYRVQLEKLKAAQEQRRNVGENIASEVINDESVERFNKMEIAWMDLAQEMESATDEGKIKKIKDRMEAVAMAMSPDELERTINDTLQMLDELQDSTLETLDNMSEEELKMLEEFDEKALQTELSILQQAKEAKRREGEEENYLRTQIEKTTATTTKETGAISGNTKAKNNNAVATGKMGAAESATNKTLKASDPVLRKVKNGITNISKAIKAFITTNPILAALTVGIAALATAVSIYAKKVREANAEAKMFKDISLEVGNAVDDENVRLRVLLQTAESETESLKERKKAVEELNKLVPNYNARIDETTGLYKANTKALDEYIKKTEQRLLLEAYEGKIKEYLQQQLDLRQKINKYETDGWSFFHYFFGQVQNAHREIKSLDTDIQKMFDAILKLDLSDALDINKPNTGGKSAVRTLQEMLTDIKTLYKQILSDMVKTVDLKDEFNGVYDELEAFRNRVYELVAGSAGTDIGKAFTENFLNAIENGLQGLDSKKLTLGEIFNADAVKELSSQLVEAEKVLAGYMADQSAVTEDVIKKQKEKVQALREEVTTLTEIAKAVKDYTKAVDEQFKRKKEVEDWNRTFEQTKMLYDELRDDTRTNNPFKDINQSITKATFALQNLNDELRRLNDEEQSLRNGPQNKETVKRLEEIAKRRRELAQEQWKLENQLEEAGYQKRLMDIQKLYEQEKKNAENRDWGNKKRELDWGNGGETYNTELQGLDNQRQMLENQKLAVEKYYEEQMAAAGENTEQWLLLEKEKNAAIEDLDQQLAENQIKRDKATSERRLKVAKAYVSAYQAISNQTLNIMNAVMDGMDENTKEYKNMKYAQGVIDTISGTLAGFMSGVESGIPAPYNLILAAATAAGVFATGMIQLNNLKNENLANGANASVNSGEFSTYDTLAYAQNNEILGSITDARVYVVESDITTTQNKVKVTEANSRF